MKKAFFLTGLLMMLAVFTVEASDLPQGEINQEKMVKPETDVSFTKVVPFWECWDYTVSCGSGFVCANSYAEAVYKILLIELYVCDEEAPCEDECG